MKAGLHKLRERVKSFPFKQNEVRFSSNRNTGKGAPVNVRREWISSLNTVRQI